MTGRSKKYENDKMEDIPDELNNGMTDDNSEAADAEEDKEKAEVKCPDNDKTALLEKEIMDYRDKLMRKAAEFENYKKRTSDEFVRLIDTANEDLMLSLLPVIDDLDRFMKNYNPELKAEGLKKGIDLIYDKFCSNLNNFGLNEIDCVGKDFDPALHDALLMVEKDGVQPNIVIDQHEKGYMLKNKVIRHSKVIVSK
ncbi:MAG TPA: nucleotide exchange factor GrpE [Clostridiales bacterium]|nr:nucleotide exchange factor GrpE [Clostridiales bacterium]HQP68943.1 nucleotide exchange factor GrpE [Clostridiales bacterium]